MKTKQILAFVIMLECSANYAFLPNLIQNVIQSAEDSLVTVRKSDCQQKTPQSTEANQENGHTVDERTRRKDQTQNNGERMPDSEPSCEQQGGKSIETNERFVKQREEHAGEEKKQEEDTRKEEENNQHQAYQEELAKNRDRIEAMASLTKELSAYLQGEFTNKLYFVCKIHDQLYDITKTTEQKDFLCKKEWDQWGMGPLARSEKLLPPSDYLIRGILEEKTKKATEYQGINVSINKSKEGKSLEEDYPGTFRVNDITFRLWNGQYYSLTFQFNDLSQASEMIGKVSIKTKELLKEWLDEQYMTACAFGETNVWGQYFSQTHKKETAPVKILKEIALGDTLIEVLKKISQIDPSFKVAYHNGTPDPSFTVSSHNKKVQVLPPMAYGRQYDFTLKNHTLTFGFGGFDNESAVNLLWAKVAFNTGSVEVETLEELLTKRFPAGFALSKKTKKVGMHWKDPENTPQFIGEQYADAALVIGMSAMTRKEGGELLASEREKYAKALKTKEEIEKKYMEPTYVYYIGTNHSGYDVVVNTLEKVPGIASDYIVFDLDTHNLQIDLYNRNLREKRDAAKKEEQEKAKKDAEAALDI